MSFDWSIKGGMPHFYRGGNSGWWRGSEGQSCHDGEEKRTGMVVSDNQKMKLHSCSKIKKYDR